MRSRQGFKSWAHDLATQCHDLKPLSPILVTQAYDLACTRHNRANYAQHFASGTKDLVSRAHDLVNQPPALSPAHTTLAHGHVTSPVVYTTLSVRHPTLSLT